MQILQPLIYMFLADCYPHIHFPSHSPGPEQQNYALPLVKNPLGTLVPTSTSGHYVNKSSHLFCNTLNCAISFLCSLIQPTIVIDHHHEHRGHEGSFHQKYAPGADPAQSGHFYAQGSDLLPRQAFKS